MSIAHDELAARLAPHQGDWLRKSLDVSGVSAIEMAELIDVSRRTMTNYLSGRTSPRPRMLREWSVRTGVPLSYLERGVINDEAPRPDGPGEGLDVHPLGLEPRTH